MSLSSAQLPSVLEPSTAMAFFQKMFSLEGQTALVTGGTRGIGQAMAIALAEAGADILLVQRSPTSTTTKTTIESLGRKATIYAADLSSEPSIAALVPNILADGHTIDILLNCGGIHRRHLSRQFADSDWAKGLLVNPRAVYMLCRDVGAHMLSKPIPDPISSQKRRGSIINIASHLSFQGGLNVPDLKSGIVWLTKGLSIEWAAHGITVNAIAPGYIATDMNTTLMEDEERAEAILKKIPAGRWGRPEDFQAAVVFLAGAGSGYVSGEVVTVDGGWTAREDRG